MSKTNSAPELNFPFSLFKQAGRREDVLPIDSQAVPIQFVRNRRARRYVIRVRPDGTVRATVPRHGSLREARAFAERHADWIAKQLQKRPEHPVHPRSWQHGTEILYRGAKVQLIVSSNHAEHCVQIADQVIPVLDVANLRPAIERHLWQLATGELPARTWELAKQHGLSISRVTVRNQRSRWGSCSRRGTISLNWRLIQAPAAVRDYIILHELMHWHEANHSARFWQRVAEACPEYEQAEVWLKQQRGLLR